MEESVYGKCLSCGAIEAKLNKQTTTLDYSSIGESSQYPAGYGCEFCG